MVGCGSVERDEQGDCWLPLAKRQLLPDATDLLFSAWEVSRQRCRIFSLAIAAQSAHGSHKQVA